MKHVIYLISIVFLFSACSHKSINYNKNAHLKAFGAEDFYIIHALEAMHQKQYIDAYKIYKNLYDRSKKNEYINASFTALLLAQQANVLLEEIDAIEADFSDSALLQQFRVRAYLQNQNYEFAKLSALKLLEMSKRVQDYELVAQVYMKQKNYKSALKYLQSAYAIDYNEQVLDKIATIMFTFLDQKKEALSFLESHSRQFGCSELICGRLGSFYNTQNNTAGMINVYKRLYDKFKADEYANYLIRIYNHKKDYGALERFLEESGYNQFYLLDVYISLRQFQKASKLANTLFLENGDYALLGQSAILEFEGTKNKHNTKFLEKIVNKLKHVTKQSPNAMYFNYLGYLLIDYDLNIKEGISYVKKALKLEPNSPFYLDSLAWGYYKLGKCKKANDLMQTVVAKMGKKDKEIKIHLKAISQCLKR